MTLVSLPIEIHLSSLFTHLDDKSLARLACTCTLFNTLVSDYWRRRDVVVGKRALTEHQHRHLCKLGVTAVIYTDWIEHNFFVGQHCPKVSIRAKFGSGNKHWPGSRSSGIEACGEYLCFHPGYSMPHGAYRGFGLPNTDMGFVPAQDVLHPWEINIRRSGYHTVSIGDGMDPSRQPFLHECSVNEKPLLPSERSAGYCKRVCTGGNDDVKGENVFVRVECSLEDSK